MEEGKSDVFILAGEKIFIGISIPEKRSFYIKWQADVECMSPILEYIVA